MSLPNHYTGLAGHSHEPTEPPVQAGVLLVNLGTPTAPTAQAVRPFLAEFLADPRVIEYPRWLWWLILHGVILRVRPRRSAHAYARIWTYHGSPLRFRSEALAEGLQAELGRQRPAPCRVALALRVVNAYRGHPAYIEALAGSIESWWRANGRRERLLLPFHGIPERYVHAGDPYLSQCLATARLLRERLGLGEQDMLVSFQSRLGRERWLQPYTDATVRRLGAEGVRKLDVACPGFAVDCLETLEEIAMQNRDFFIAAGGESLRYIPALNDSRGQLECIATLVLQHTRGWDGFAMGRDAAARQDRREAGQHARELGARAE